MIEKCILCSSKGNKLIHKMGYLCDKCFEKWKKFYYSFPSDIRMNAWKEDGGIWNEFTREFMEEKVVFT